MYIGSAAGTGKTYRMLQEAHDLRRRGIDVVVGFVETHGRAETEAQIGDLEVVPRQKIEYRGVTLEEMDVDARHRAAPAGGDRRRARAHQRARRAQRQALAGRAAAARRGHQRHLRGQRPAPRVAERRAQRELGVTVRETVPDWVVGQADQVVNLDISAEDLRQRLREGKIYTADKIQTALANFFTDENLTTLRELALREVASSVDRSREEIVRREDGAAPRRAAHGGPRHGVPVERPAATRACCCARRAASPAGSTPTGTACTCRRPTSAPTASTARVQRHLVDNIQLAQSLGAEVVKLEGGDVAADARALRRRARRHAGDRRADAALALVSVPARLDRRPTDRRDAGARRARRLDLRRGRVRAPANARIDEG